MNLRIWPGRPYPLGATWDGSGTNFALYFRKRDESRTLSVRFDQRRKRIAAHRAAGADRHGLARLLARRGPRSIYGYRVDGPHKPSEGHRFNANKVLLDPYAKAIARQTRWSDEMWGYKLGDPEGDLSFDERDNARYAPLAAVLDEAFTWGDDRLPRNPWHKTLIYELPREGIHQVASRRAGKPARHLRRRRIGRLDSLPQEPGHHGG